MSFAFKRKLFALSYPNCDKVDITDEKSFRNLVVYLEEQHIRLLTIENRSQLREIGSENWTQVFNKYLEDLECPLISSSRASLVDWLLGVAISRKYSESKDALNNMTSEAFRKKLEQLSLESKSPFDSIDPESEEFKNGVHKLSGLLQIPSHPDHKQMLKACCLVIEQKLSKENIEKAIAEQGKLKTMMLPNEQTTGLHTSEGVFQEVGMILRLLHIHELRNLQTSINAALVQVQAVTADPRTDERLGKVGF